MYLSVFIYLINLLIRIKTADVYVINEVKRYNKYERNNTFNNEKKTIHFEMGSNMKKTTNEKLYGTEE